MSEALPHQPVLYHEIIHILRPHSAGYYVDGTIGAGGHAWGILKASEPDGLLLGLDLDPLAISLARERLKPFGSRVFLVQASYTSLIEQLTSLGWSGLDGILLDLGVSSMQVDNPQRGFSFQEDGPLDMRFDPTNPITAADLVNNMPETELANLLFRYGEERNSRRIAREIVRVRPIGSTKQLAEVVTRVVRSGRSRIHPATRTFQALRIAVNRELDALETSLPFAIGALKSGGRLAVISFHSLEDRIVKQYFRRESRDCICPPKQPVCTCGHHATVKELNRRPIRPGEIEIQENPRARSARLRVVEKLPTQ
jgi:16S rRNA (cytosine1402-N4)-methyltransferase